MEPGRRMGRPLWLEKFDTINRKMMSRKITSVIEMSMVVVILCLESRSFMRDYAS